MEKGNYQDRWYEWKLQNKTGVETENPRNQKQGPE